MPARRARCVLLAAGHHRCSIGLYRGDAAVRSSPSNPSQMSRYPRVAIALLLVPCKCASMFTVTIGEVSPCNWPPPLASWRFRSSPNNSAREVDGRRCCLLFTASAHLCFRYRLGNFSCPLQQNEGDIPIVWHDIRSKVDGLRRTFRTLLHRDRAICPFQVNGIPVTPHKNPITDMTSKHIIRLWDSKPPKQHEHRRCVVDLLMQDCDGYFAAFRRIEFTVEQLEAALAGAGNGQGLLGRWFSLQGMVVPAFLNAREAEISSSHNGARPGGDTVFESILYTLAKFETDNGEPGVVTPDVQRAAWNVMVMLCEIRRLRSLLVLVNHRIQYDLVPHKLSDGFWKLIRNWSNFSKIVLIARRDGNLELTDQLQKSWCSTFHNKTKMECLIGINGELLEIKLDPTLVGMTIKEFEQRWREAGGNVPEPGFVPQM